MLFRYYPLREKEYLENSTRWHIFRAAKTTVNGIFKGVYRRR